MRITETNWYIAKCENSHKYMLSVNNEPVYSGSYTQCLVVLGGAMNYTFEFAVALANSVNEIIQ
jgi:hypothetical protein